MYQVKHPLTYQSKIKDGHGHLRNVVAREEKHKKRNISHKSMGRYLRDATPQEVE